MDELSFPDRYTAIGYGVLAIILVISIIVIIYAIMMKVSPQGTITGTPHFPASSPGNVTMIHDGNYMVTNRNATTSNQQVAASSGCACHKG